MPRTTVRPADLTIGDKIFVIGEVNCYRHPQGRERVMLAGIEADVFGGTYASEGELTLQHAWIETGTSDDLFGLYIDCTNANYPLIERLSSSAPAHDHTAVDSRIREALDASRASSMWTTSTAWTAGLPPVGVPDSTSRPWNGWGNVQPGDRVSDEYHHVYDVDNCPEGTIIVRIGQDYFYDPRWEYDGTHWQMRGNDPGRISPWRTMNESERSQYRQVELEFEALLEVEDDDEEF